MTVHDFAYVFPFLLVMAAIQEIPKQAAKPILPTWPIVGSALAAIISAILIRMDVKGIPLAGWLTGVNANFSIPLTTLLFSRVLRNATGIILLDRQALQTTWIFGLVTGFVLYPQALGLRFGSAGRLDPYALGYGSVGFSLVLLALTIVLLIMKNRFGVVLVAAMAAYNLQVLESPNLWDYLVDPVLVILSMVALAVEIVRRFHRRRTQPPSPTKVEPAQDWKDYLR